MYVKKNIIKKVIELFTDKPECRDDRWETIKTVTESIRKEHPEFPEWSMIQLAFDVDRAFRYVQQHIPSLRGKSWLERQLMSGELSKEEYEKHMEHYNFMKEISNESYQGKLF